MGILLQKQSFFQYGNLKPSEEIKLLGEIESMMDNIGCYIRYDFNLAELNVSTNEPLLIKSAIVESAEAKITT